MERLDCQLRFPGHPEGDLDFAVTTHQLVLWLMGLFPSAAIGARFAQWVLAVVVDRARRCS
jgi:hypothetical protein